MQNKTIDLYKNILTWNFIIKVLKKNKFIIKN